MSENWAEIKKLHQVMKLEDGERMSELTIRINGDVDTLREIVDFIDAKVLALNKLEASDDNPYHDE